jgi:glycosyltransferase involved in cell wall biosynthesis
MMIPPTRVAGQFSVRDWAGYQVRKTIDVQRCIFDSYAKIFALCRCTKESIVGENGQDEARVVVIKRGSNISPINVTAGKHKGKEIFFVGYGWERKGRPLLLVAFALAMREMRGAVLNIVGHSPSIRRDGVNVVGSLNSTKIGDLRALERLYNRFFRDKRGEVRVAKER